MIPIAEAQALVLGSIKPLRTERVDLFSALHRVLAEPVFSSLDFPRWNSSVMDGYAVRSEDLGVLPATLPVVEEIAAGIIPQHQLEAGETSRIFTGAMMPAGADAVVIQENTMANPDGTVRILKSVNAGANMVRQGTHLRVGDLLMSAGTVLRAPEIGILSSVGRSFVSVYRRPVVAILSTGNELVPLGQELKPGHIIDSNQYALATQVIEAGAVPRLLGVVKDDVPSLTQAITEALDADFILSSGGVSVGDYDHVQTVLQDLGAQILFQKVRVKPGKPLTFALLNQVAYWGLPGNPVSCLVGFWLTVYPAIRKSMGYPKSLQNLPILSARLTAPTEGTGDRETYVRGVLYQQEEQLYFTPRSSHASGNLVNLQGINGFGIVPVGTEKVEQSMDIQVLQVDTLQVR
ncbi:MAG: gephyrin-like molybdotransferase Glp [Gloeobacterales cyanobacterium]